MSDQSKSEELLTKIASAWRAWAPPLAPLEAPKDFEDQDIEEWLLGKRFDELAEAPMTQSNMPLLSLSSSGCAYYLATYLILAVKAEAESSEGEPCADFPTIHLASFLADEESFGHCFVKLFQEQKDVLKSVIDLLIKWSEGPISKETRLVLQNLLKGWE